MKWNTLKNLNPITKIQEKIRKEEERRRAEEEAQRKAEEARKAAAAKKKKLIIIGSIAGGAVLTLIFAIGIISERQQAPKHEASTYTVLNQIEPKTEADTTKKPTVPQTTVKVTEKPTVKPTEKPTEAPNTKKFHYPDCSSVRDMKEKNKQVYTGRREDVIAQGYSPCKRCNP